MSYINITLVEDYHFLFALSEYDKKLLTWLANVHLKYYDNTIIPKFEYIQFDKWLQQQLDNKHFEVLWEIFDFDQNILFDDWQEKYHFPLPTLEWIENQAEQYTDKNDTVWRFMVWLDTLKEWDKQGLLTYYIDKK